MSELETVQRLERETGLLAMRATEAEMKVTAHAFTVRVAQTLRAKGWALVRADPPANNVNGVRIDKIIHRVDLSIVDIIVNADDPHGATRRAVWQDVGLGVPRDVVDPPIDGDGGGGGGGGGGGEQPDDIAGALTLLLEDTERIAHELEELVSIGKGAILEDGLRIAEALEALVGIGKDIKSELGVIREKGLTVRWR